MMSLKTFCAKRKQTINIKHYHNYFFVVLGSLSSVTYGYVDANLRKECGCFHILHNGNVCLASYA